MTETGSAGDDQAWDLAVNDAGETTVAVRTTGALATTNAGGLDAAFVRYAADGSVRWMRQIGTAADDFGHSVTMSADGTAYVVGFTKGALEPPQPSMGGDDMFVARYDTDGMQRWLHQRGSTGDEQAHDVTLDPSGNVWLTGYTNGALDGQPLAGGQDVFAMRFTADGLWSFTRTFGGPGSENSFGIGAAADGSVVLE